MDYGDHSKVLELYESAKDSDKDNLIRARECEDFLHKRDGQWEQHVYSNFSKKPRYTLDLVNPIVDQIAGEVRKANFDIKVKPAGGEATDDAAKLLDGMIRNIENISNASRVYSKAAEGMIGAGVDGWQVVQDWAEEDSFDQDLFIKPVFNFIDSVVFDPSSQEQDRSDAMWAMKLTTMSKDEYAERWPDREPVSIDASTTRYEKCQDELITVGEFYLVKLTDKILIKMNNGAVYSEDDVLSVVDELAERGITEEARRTRPSRGVSIRHLDGGGWLGDEQPTVFSWIPIIPTYGKFKISNNEVIWRSKIDKILDPARINNYAFSKNVEEVVLSPKPKVWLTAEQAEGYTDTLETMSTNNDPVQFYNHVDGQAPPFNPGGAAPNPALGLLQQVSRDAVAQGAGMFTASMGNNPGLQSGVAIEALQERGDNGTLDVFESQEVAICHTAKILLNAIPKVYDAKRQVRILSEDGVAKNEIINNSVMDEETGQPVVLNDLSLGRYDATCNVGKSFKSRQQETVAAVTEVMQVDPTAIQGAEDILYSNISAPGMSLLAERKREQNFNSGYIPRSQWTEEEMQIAQNAQNQEPAPDPNMLIAQAEMEKAKADSVNAENKRYELQINAELKQQSQQIELAKLQQKAEESTISAAQKQEQFDVSLQLDVQKLALDAEANNRANMESMSDMQAQQKEMAKTQAETLVIMRDLLANNQQ